MKSSAFLLLGILCAFSSPKAQSPFLLKDINRNLVPNGSSRPQGVTVLGGLVFFTADDGMHGRELYVATSAPGSARLVKDIRPGYKGSNPMDLTPAGNHLFFSAEDGVHGRELWVTDGSAAGTRLVKDIRPGPAKSTPLGLGAFGNRVFFRAEDVFHGVELWVSDGTPSGTRLVKDIHPGPKSSIPHGFTAFGAYVYFIASDGVHGNELWRSDGTAAGTRLVKDIFPGGTGSEPVYLTPGKKYLFFSASDVPYGRELWRTDGTTGGTILLKDISPGGKPSDPAGLLFSGGRLFFAAREALHGRELWMSDGTPAGTVLVKDIYPGYIGSSPAGFVSLGGGKVIFSASDPAHGCEPWVSDGTPGGTRLVKDIKPGRGSSQGCFSSMVLQGCSLGAGKALFGADDGIHGIEPWVTDGTPAGTLLVKDVYPGSRGSMGGNEVFMGLTGKFGLFPAADGVHGFELWITDGTPKGTRLLADPDYIPGRTYSSREYWYFSAPGRLGDSLLFAAGDGVHGMEPWISDGTPGGTRMVADLDPRKGYSSSPIFWGEQAFFLGGKELYFFLARDPKYGYQAWATDGTAAGTRRLTRRNGFHYSEYEPVSFFSALGKVFFCGDWGIWATDGTQAGTILLKDFKTSPASRKPELKILGSAGGKVVFAARTASGSEPWVTDGTRAGTSLLKDINPGPKGSYPFGGFNGEVKLGDRLFFIADDGKHGGELWVTDGTAAGTKMVKEIFPGPAGPSPRCLLAWKGAVYFFAWNGKSWGLWKSDGKAAGTRRLNNSLAVAWHPPYFSSDLTPSRNYLFFAGETAGSGPEPARTDGTAAGTILLGDLWPGSEGSLPSFMASLGEGFLFKARTPNHGWEAWFTDGTSKGTILLKDIDPNPDSLGPCCFFSMGSRRAVFSADDGIHGWELWVTDGTPRGTRMEADLRPGSLSSYPVTAGLVGDKLLFFAEDSPHGREVWAWRPGAMSWRVPSGLARGAVRPELYATDPVLGGRMRVYLEGIPSPGGAMLVLGLRGVLNLGPLVLRANPAFPLAVLPWRKGLSVPVPSDSSLAGVPFSLQALVYPGGPPPWGLAAGNAVYLTPGR